MFTMALYILIPVRLMAKWSGLVVTAPCITIAALVAALVLQPWHTAFPLTLGAIAGVLATAIFGVVVSYLLFLKGLREAGAVVGGLLDSVEPVAAMGFSALLLGTPITNFDAIGALLIISMMVLVALPEKKPDAGGALDAGMKPNASEITDADMKPSAVPSPQEPI
jgi:drug/metabolite transporter (DMT)-like permease